MKTTIRSASPADSVPIAQLIQELAVTAGEESPITAAYVPKYLSTPANAVLLAEGGERIIGLLAYSLRPDLYHAADTCFIEDLIVEAAFRGQGVGGRLLDELFARLAPLDCAEVSVSTLPDNAEALEFYRKHGLSDEGILLEKHFKNREAQA